MQMSGSLKRRRTCSRCGGNDHNKVTFTCGIPLHLDTVKALTPALVPKKPNCLRTYGRRVAIGFNSFFSELSLRNEVLQSRTWRVDALVSIQTPTQCCLSMLNGKYILSCDFSKCFSSGTSANLSLEWSLTVDFTNRLLWFIRATGRVVS
ncbi:hypothetical protein YC2023_115268 [Brassica napus]